MENVYTNKTNKFEGKKGDEREKIIINYRVSYIWYFNISLENIFSWVKTYIL